VSVETEVWNAIQETPRTVSAITARVSTRHEERVGRILRRWAEQGIARMHNDGRWAPGAGRQKKIAQPSLEYKLRFLEALAEQYRDAEPVRDDILGIRDDLERLA